MTIDSSRIILHRSVSATVAVYVRACVLMLPFFASSSQSYAIQTESPQDTNRKTLVVGTIVDADTGQPIAARVYLQDRNQQWLFVRTASEQGSAWPYAEQWVPMPNSVERHTTVSAHPFQVELSPGKYEIEIERGKEYLPLRQQLVIPANDATTTDPNAKSNAKIERTFRLKRWINLSERGWYSGETHVHRRIVELPNVMLAEDLNVAFPVTFWTTASDKVPDLQPSTLRSQGPSPFGPRDDRGYDPIRVSDRHVILPRNTEYEIFNIGPQRHTLGALFILNHKSPFTLTAPPIGPIVQQARAEDALLDLDKHNWPWSLMLIPVANVDLYELSNNSVWRTNFGFNQLGQPLPPWAEIEQETSGVLTEWGWLQYGFEMYYALLNCGFRLSPTAGTASGVHPVPLGYSRVYVHTGEKFSLTTWLAGLKQGRSFVTTGPMLFAQVGGQHAGTVFPLETKNRKPIPWSAEVVSPEPITRVELIVHGEVRASFSPNSSPSSNGSFRWTGEGAIDVTESGWVAFRTWSDQPDGRKRFAHTGSWYFEVVNQPVRPPRVQIDYLIDQLELSMQAQRGILPPAAFAEFEQARDAYRLIQQRAR